MFVVLTGMVAVLGVATAPALLLGLFAGHPDATAASLSRLAAIAMIVLAGFSLVSAING